MRIVILSDVHANLSALEAVLRHADAGGPVDAVWCLGDTVGYGPQPGECVSRLREAGATIVAGNHDRAATGMMGVEEFNPDAAAAALWTRGQLSHEDAAFLNALPEVTGATGAPGPGQTAARASEFTLVHGTLRRPVWEYLYTHETALAHLQRQRTPFGLVGHTHVPLLAVEGEQYPQGCELYRLQDGDRIELRDDLKLVINPGGVGQPRDGDPRAAYALYDTESASVTIVRVEYDIAATQALMAEAGLPRWLIDRLAEGR
jgi:predicted phosphodiesterase